MTSPRGLSTQAPPPPEISATPVRRLLLPAPAAPRNFHVGKAWERGYVLASVLGDLLMLAIACWFAYVARFGTQQVHLGGTSYVWVSAIGIAAWMAILAASGAYEHRPLSFSADEVKRVFNASVRFVAGVALLAYALKLPLSRAFVVMSLVLGTVLVTVSRQLGHAIVRWLRSSGRMRVRMLVVGDHERVADLVAQANREPGAGLSIIGACTPSTGQGQTIHGTDVPVVGTVSDVVDAVVRCKADTVAVTASPGVSPRELRRIAWQLEGTGVGLFVAPGLTDVAGPRIQVRPIGSRMPLLHVEAPEFTGLRKLLKETQDRLIAGVALVALMPFLLVLAIAIRLDSRGPAFFTQTRVGRGGRTFTCVKFRSMTHGADRLVINLRERNESDPSGLLFKIRNDPRVTRMGRLMRRFSLDELPQLVNVVKGDMALVGPRPPLPDEVEQYADEVRRRLLVKPGITGLWQVSGRSDLSWEDSVRLDLYYVENWSLALDMQIIAKTAVAVLSSRGAY